MYKLVIFLMVLVSLGLSTRIYYEKQELSRHAAMEARAWGAYRQYNSREEFRRPAACYFRQMEPLTHPGDRMHHLKQYGDR